MHVFRQLFSSAVPDVCKRLKTLQAPQAHPLGSYLPSAPTQTSVRPLNPKLWKFYGEKTCIPPPPGIKRGLSFKHFSDRGFFYFLFENAHEQKFQRFFALTMFPFSLIIFQTLSSLWLFKCWVRKKFVRSSWQTLSNLIALLCWRKCSHYSLKACGRVQRELKPWALAVHIMIFSMLASVL